MVAREHRPITHESGRLRTRANPLWSNSLSADHEPSDEPRSGNSRRARKTRRRRGRAPAGAVAMSLAVGPGASRCRSRRSRRAEWWSVVVRSTLLQMVTPGHRLGWVPSATAIFIGSSSEIGAFESGMAGKAAADGAVRGGRRARDAGRRGHYGGSGADASTVAGNPIADRGGRAEPAVHEGAMRECMAPSCFAGRCRSAGRRPTRRTDSCEWPFAFRPAA